MKISSIQPQIYLKQMIAQKEMPKIQKGTSCASLPDFGGKYGFFTSNIHFAGIKKAKAVNNKDIYADTKAFSKYLHEKIEKELMVPSLEDVKNTINNVKTKTNADEKTVREVITRLVQFSNTKSLDEISNQFARDNVKEVYDDNVKFSTTNFMNYLTEVKGQILTSRRGRTAVFADSKFLSNYAKNRSSMRFLPFEVLNHKDLMVYVMDGWNGKAEGKKQLYSMFGRTDSLENIAVKVIERMQKNGESFDDVFNKKTIEKAKNLFGDRAEIKVIQHSSVNDTSDENIKKLMTPPMPTEDEIESFIDILADGLMKSYSFQAVDENKLNIRALIAKYLDNMLVCYSPKSMNEELKNKHSEIENIAAKSGYTSDKINYVLKDRTQTKSFDLIMYQYMLANGINENQIVKLNATRKSNNLKQSDDKEAYVVMDDFSGSGESLIDVGNLTYFELGKKHMKGDIFFAPLVIADEAEETICRNSDDKIVKAKFLSHKKFLDDSLSKRERACIPYIEGDGGYAACGTCCSFPFSNPDNNSNLGSLFASLFQGNRYAEKMAPKGLTWEYSMSSLDLINKIEKHEHKMNCPLIE